MPAHRNRLHHFRFPVIDWCDLMTPFCDLMTPFRENGLCSSSPTDPIIAGRGSMDRKHKLERLRQQARRQLLDTEQHCEYLVSSDEIFRLVGHNGLTRVRLDGRRRFPTPEPNGGEVPSATRRADTAKELSSPTEARVLSWPTSAGLQMTRMRAAAEPICFTRKLTDRVPMVWTVLAEP